AEINYCEPITLPAELCSGWQPYGEWIYWRLNPGSLPMGVEIVGSTISGKTYNVPSEYAGGYRVGIRKTTGCLDFDASYTYINHKPHGHATNLSAVTQPSIGITSTTSTTVDARYAHRLDTIDIQGGLQLSPNCCIDLRIFLGPKITFISDSYRKSTASTTITADLKSNQKLNLYGGTGGVDAAWKWTSWFQIFGTASIDLYYADVTKRHRLNSTESSVTTTVFESRESTIRAMSTINGRIGIRLCFRTFCQTDVIFSGGYEIHHWPDYEFIALLHPTPGSNRDSSTYDGLFTRFDIRF
ncbi:MAG: hypothetical protein KDK40_01535, partial [Chlamydiia bacterium]|nr:hypothetical protein [Chlamydiia bacterium]